MIARPQGNDGAADTLHQASATLIDVLWPGPANRFLD